MDHSLEEKYRSLLKKNSLLDEQLAELKSKGVSTDLQPQIEALHDYNAMKDLAQAILGHLSNAEQIPVGELHKRYELPLD